MKICSWTELSFSEQEDQLLNIQRIFFSSSARQEFESAKQKQDFWQKWTAYYFRHQPHWIFLLFQSSDLAGYLMACPESENDKAILADLNPSFLLFADQIAAFPAHLHINLDSRFRGLGLGEQLLTFLSSKLKAAKIGGVHIVTAPHARNVHFYRRNGFDIELERLWKTTPLLFMGRKINL